MFNNLDEQIESTVGETSTPAARVLRYLIVAALSIILFGGLFLGVWFLEF
jgi:hypothetical protein